MFLNKRRNHTCFMIGVAALAALVALFPSYGATADKAPIALNVAMVPTVGGEPFYYAKSQGYYRDAGLAVHFFTNDAGPAVITGVINGTYAAAAAAWFPISIAVSKGAKLKMIMTSNYVDKQAMGSASALVVKPGSPIKGYADLPGKKVATNALTSLTVLDTKAMVKKAGGNPADIHFVELPFKTASQAVARGQVDAAVVIPPFGVEAAAAGMKIIGDPITEAEPENGALLSLFTSDAGWKKHAKALKAFRDATFRAARELSGNAALERRVAEQSFGIQPTVAAKLMMPGFATTPIDAAAFQKQLDMAAEFGFLAHPLKAAELLVQP